MTKHVFRRSQGYPDRRLLHPIRDWFIGLCIFMVLMASGGAYAASLYVNYQHIDTTAQVKQVKVPTLDSALVQATTERYAARAAQYSALVGHTFATSTPTSTPEVATSTKSTASTSKLTQPVGAPKLQP